MVTFSKQRLTEILEKRKVLLAYLFGSQATGKTGPLSDMDIAIYFDERLGSNERFDLRLEVLGELTDMFKTDEIDLVVLNDAPPLLAHRIIKDGTLLFCGDDRLRVEHEVKVVMKYMDWKPYLDKYTEEVFGSDTTHGG